MKQNFLLPNKWKKWGWGMFLIGLGLFFAVLISDGHIKFTMPIFGHWGTNFVVENNVAIGPTTYWGLKDKDIVPTIIILLSVIGLLIMYFSREKVEDEMTSKMRLDSLAWATILNCLLILYANITFWDLDFLMVLELNMASILIIAVLRYEHLKFWLNRSKKSILLKKERFLISRKWLYIGSALFAGALGMHISSILHGYGSELLFPKTFDLAWNNAIEFILGKAPAHLSTRSDYKNIYDTLVVCLGIIGLLFITFSKEKVEDEYISDIRLNALSWAIISHYFMIIIATILIWGENYIEIMAYAMFTPMIFFIVRFNYLKYKMRKSLVSEIMEGEA